MRKVWKGSAASALCIIIAIVALIVLAHFLGLNKYVTLPYLQGQGVSLKQYADNHYPFSMLLYLLIYIPLITVLPIVVPLTLMGGFIFGLIPGFILSLIAATIGSVLSMVTIRYFLAPMIQARYQKKLQAFNTKISQYGSTYLLTLQLLSVIPYIITDILTALTNVSVATFAWTFVVGNIPLIFILSYTGQHLAIIRSFGEILTPQILIGFAILALLALLPTILKRFNISL